MFFLSKFDITKNIKKSSKMTSNMTPFGRSFRDLFGTFFLVALNRQPENAAGRLRDPWGTPITVQKSLQGILTPPRRPFSSPETMFIYHFACACEKILVHPNPSKTNLHFVAGDRGRFNTKCGCGGFAKRLQSAASFRMHGVVKREDTKLKIPPYPPPASS